MEYILKGNIVINSESEASTYKEIIDGSPRGVYANLSALQTAFPTGTSGVYLTSDNGHWHYWNGTAWADGGVYQAVEIADGSVTPEKTNFVENYSFNMLDKNKSIDGKKKIGNNINDDTGYFYNTIKVAPNTVYTFSQAVKKNTWISEYSSINSFISGTDKVYYGKKSITITTGSGTNYIVITIDIANKNSAQLELGEIATQYKEYKENLKFNNEIENVANTKYMHGKNLFNKNEATPSQNDYYKITIKVESNTAYTFSQKDKKNLWKKELDEKGATSVANTGIYGKLEYTFTTNENTKYIILTIDKSQLDYFQLELGEKATEYEEYYSGNYMDKNVKIDDLIKLQKKVDSINQNVNSINNGYATTKYIDKEDSLIAKVQQKFDKNMLVFSLFTDVHGSDILNDYTPPTSSTIYGNYGYKNYRDFAKLVKNISEEIGVDFIVNLGDTINSTIDEASGDNNKIETKKRLCEFTKNIQSTSIPYIYATAHHELHPFNQTTNDGFKDKGMIRSEVYGISNRYTRNINIISNNDDTNKNYFYFDMPVQKVRIIVLDSCCNTNFGYSDVELNWLTNIALNTENKIIVFSHMGTKGNNTGLDNIPLNGENIENVLKQNGKVIGYFHGHTHWDNIIIPSQSGTNFPYIATVNSWCIKTKLPDNVSEYLGTPTVYDRTYDTYSEYAFDIITINCDNGEINMYRFGVGNDRTYIPENN